MSLCFSTWFTLFAHPKKVPGFDQMKEAKVSSRDVWLDTPCRIHSSHESYSQNRRVLYPSILWLFYVWANRKKRNISYFFAIGWNRRALYPWVCKLRLWDWGLVSAIGGSCKGVKNERVLSTKVLTLSESSWTSWMMQKEAWATRIRLQKALAWWNEVSTSSERFKKNPQ
jgi:hypothetical protein